jgi:hypothetical protein
MLTVEVLKETVVKSSMADGVTVAVRVKVYRPSSELVGETSIPVAVVIAHVEELKAQVIETRD